MEECNIEETTGRSDGEGANTKEDSMEIKGRQSDRKEATSEEEDGGDINYDLLDKEVDAGETSSASPGQQVEIRKPSSPMFIAMNPGGEDVGGDDECLDVDDEGAAGAITAETTIPKEKKKKGWTLEQEIKENKARNEGMLRELGLTHAGAYIAGDNASKSKKGRKKKAAQGVKLTVPEEPRRSERHLVRYSNLFLLRNSLTSL